MLLVGFLYRYKLLLTQVYLSKLNYIIVTRVMKLKTRCMQHVASVYGPLHLSRIYTVSLWRNIADQLVSIRGSFEDESSVHWPCSSKVKSRKFHFSLEETSCKAGRTSEFFHFCTRLFLRSFDLR